MTDLYHPDPTVGLAVFINDGDPLNLNPLFGAQITVTGGYGPDLVQSTDVLGYADFMVIEAKSHFAL